MNFTSVRGHLQGWHVPPNIEDNWQVDPIVLFDCPVTKKTAEDLEPVARMLKTEAKRADWLILWLDCEYVLCSTISNLNRFFIIFKLTPRDGLFIV